MKKLNTFVLDTTIYILDFLYRGRDFQRFWVLEVIARAPYFAFISVLHFRESLGLRGEEHVFLMKEHFYQALNETEHLEEMELREGNKYWIDRFFAKHLVLLYYWIMVAYYLINPINAYDINMKIEKHAYETYVKYLAYHPEDKKIAEIAEDGIRDTRLSRGLGDVYKRQIQTRTTSVCRWVGHWCSASNQYEWYCQIFNHSGTGNHLSLIHI